jgi:hypothetical protein
LTSCSLCEDVGKGVFGETMNVLCLDSDLVIFTWGKAFY